MWQLLALIGLAALFGFIVLRWLTSKKPATDQKIADRAVGWQDFDTAWLEAEEFVNQADDVSQYLVGKTETVNCRRIKQQPNGWFILGCITSFIVLFFAALGGWAVGGGSLVYGLLFGLAFTAVQIAQAYVALSGDKGTATFEKMKASDRSWGSWAALMVLLVLNFLGAFVGSQIVGASLDTRHEITSNVTRDLLAERDRITRQIATIAERNTQAGGFSRGALETKARETEEASEREAGRRGCGPKCEALKREAVQWRSLAEDAARRQTLETRLTTLNDQLAASGDAKTIANPSGQVVEYITGGLVPANAWIQQLAFLILSLLIFVDLWAWLKCGDHVGFQRARQRRLRADAANALLVNKGYEPRDFFGAGALAALTDERSRSGDTIIISAEMEPTEIIKASDDLREIDELFKDAVRADADETLTFAKLYTVYSARAAAANRATWMNQVAFNRALERYCELLKIKQRGGELIGFRLGVASEPRKTKETV